MDELMSDLRRSNPPAPLTEHPTERAWIRAEERYPDYVVDEPVGEDAKDWEREWSEPDTYDVDPVTLARWRAACESYDKVQAEIREFVNSHWDKGKRIK